MDRTEPQPPYGHWAAGARLLPEVGSSPMAVIAGTVLLLAGAFMTLISLILLVFGAAGGEFMDAVAEGAGTPGAGASLASIVVVASLIFLALGILQMVAAIGVFTHREWARWLGIALAAMGLAAGLLLVIGTLGEPAADIVAWAVAIAWLAAYVVALAGLAGGGEQFRIPVRSRH